MDFRNSLPETDLIFGRGKLNQVGKETAKYGEKILVVTGQESMKKLGYLSEVIDLLEKKT